jgi:AcrR family transcriptional regulator
MVESIQYKVVKAFDVCDRAVATSKPHRSPRPQERQRDAGRTRQLIVDAAVNEFAAYGFAGARIGASARRAGVNPQLSSYYFDGKEGLYRAIPERWLARTSEPIKPGMTLSEQMPTTPSRR